jgi:prepilin-type N-terminal cleavage/methylation domain-containing protein
MHKKLSQLHHDGFTLIEVMVSVSIFVIIITIGIGSLLTVNRALQKSRIERQATDALSYAMDTMTRRLRTGTDYQGGGDVNSITFTEQFDDPSANNGIGQTITFEKTNDSDTNYGYIQIREGSNVYRITPPEIDIKNFDVQIMRGNSQPLALISVKAEIHNQNQTSVIAIQSAVSQRPFESDSTATVTP